MKSHTITVNKITFLNHNVVQIEASKPDGYTFKPGQATDVSILKEGWKEERRPFTFTSLPEDENLQFTIKVYPSHDGTTEQIGKLEHGDKLLIDEPYGAIHYKGSGVFLAGGAGITPFLSIFKQLEKENKVYGNSLIFANKKEEDIFLQKKLKELLGEDFINILSEEESEDYDYGYIDAEYIKSNIINPKQYFYLCGPPQMVEDVTKELKSMGIEEELIVTEEFD